MATNSLAASRKHMAGGAVHRVKLRRLIVAGTTAAAAGTGLTYCLCLPITLDPDFASSWQRTSVELLRNDSSGDRSIWQTITYEKVSTFASASSLLNSGLRAKGFTEHLRSHFWREWWAGDTVVSLSQHPKKTGSNAQDSLVLEVSQRQGVGLLSEWKLSIHEAIVKRR